MTDKAEMLIVDDDADTVELLTKRLDAEGYGTSKAYDGEQALRRVSERLAAIRQTLASLAHYVKNILFGLKGGFYLVNVASKENKTDSLKTD
jgi:CheY-like chemotaxis protein